jgi:hypothetical protein
MSCFLFQCSTIGTEGQVFFAGIEGGATYNHLNTNVSKQAFSVNRNGIGYSVDVLLKLRLNKHLSLNMNPGILQKNYTLKRTDEFKGIFSKYSNTYLQIPLTAEILLSKMANNIRLFLEVGLFASYWLRSHVSGKVPAIFSATDRTDDNGNAIENFQLSYYDQEYVFQRKDNRIQLGWACGVNAQYAQNKKNKFVMSLKYFQAVTDEQKHYSINQIQRHHQTMSFSIGWFRLFK